MKRKTKEEIENLYSKYKLKILDEILGVDSPLSCVDEDGYKYSITPYNLSKRKNLNMSSGRYNNKNIYKKYNINHFMNINNVESKIIDIPQKIDKENITFICGKCNKEFKKLWKLFINTPHKYCDKCNKKNKKPKKKDISYIKNIFERNDYRFIDNESVSYGMHYSYYIEDKNGYKGRMLPYTAKKKNSKIERFTSKNKYSIYNINLYCIKNNINVICLDTKFGTYDNLKFKCSCGNIFYATWDNVKNGKFHCNKCSKIISNNEQKIINYLNKLGINFIFQYNIGKFKKYKNLFYDFYLKEYNLFIEIDGEQHYKPIRFGGISIEKANKNFEEQKLRDEIKNLYCKENKAFLLRISYNDIKNEEYKNIISTKIDELSK